jgi:tetratricopeptide (TPR) repeat protein
LNNNNFIEYEPDAETANLIKRYENVVRRKSRDYFDEEEFEMIIDHYLSINKSKEAIAAADRGSAQYPYSSELKLRYAEILIIRGDVARALQLLQHVEQMGVNDSDIHFLKARAYIRQKKFKEAEAHFEKSRQMEEREDEVLRILFSAATDWIDAKEYQRAIYCFRQLLEIDPQNEYVLNDMAYCYEQLDDLENSACCYEQCIAINPFNEVAWYNLGSIYSIQEDYEKAIQAFDFSIAIDNHNGPALFNRATVLIQLERFRDAVDTFTEYLTIDPGNTQVLCTIAECYENMDDPAMALEYYAQALKIEPECADAYYGKGLILMDRQDYDQAFDYMALALHIDAENPEYYYGLGVLLLRINANDMATQAFLRAVHYDPSDTESWLILSELVGPDLHRALDVLDRACLHNPNDPAIHFRKAALYFILKNKKACLASLEQALAIDPSDDNDFLAICPEAMMQDDIKTLYAQYKNKCKL